MKPTSSVNRAADLVRFWHEQNFPERAKKDCWLRKSLALNSHLNWLKPFVIAGFTLRSEWIDEKPHLRKWVGSRLYFAHESSFSSVQRYASILCSQLGKDFRRSPRWPTLLDSSLQDIASRGETLLLAPGTTLYQACIEFSRPTKLRTLELAIADNRQDLIEWLTCRFSNLQSPQNQVQISPEHSITSSPPNADLMTPIEGPLVDRMLMSCSNRVFALMIRHKGQLESLFQTLLLQDSTTVYLHIDPDSDATTENRNLEWLDQGAVGWFVRSPENSASFPSIRCALSDLRLHPLVAPVQGSLHDGLRNIDNTICGDFESPFLCHCTRARTLNSQEGGDYRDLQLRGQVGLRHPLQTLHEICASRKLKGSDRLNRSGQNCVSFSSRPLLELLSRRSFQSHLQRWDWEPYGLLVSRKALEALGAQPVIYGDDDDYKNLGSNAKPFFQPQGKKQDWSLEAEWRLLGDLDLSRLGEGELILFAQRKREASYLSQMYGFPAFWTESIE